MWNVIGQYADQVGIVGVILTLVAFYLLNLNKISAMSMIYLMLNLFGSLLLLFSLMFNWNLSSVLIEIAWISISLMGIYRYFVRSQANKNRKSNLYAIGDLKNSLQQNI